MNTFKAFINKLNIYKKVAFDFADKHKPVAGASGVLTGIACCLVVVAMINPGNENRPEDTVLVAEIQASDEKQDVLQDFNAEDEDLAAFSTRVFRKPVNEIVMLEKMPESSVGTGVMSNPYYGTITSRFGPRWGRRHSGTDICGELGDPVKAADTGIVITAEYQDNGYGNIVIIDHQNGIHTWYAHLDSIGVVAGDVVTKGDKIGELGTTGYSTGPHLHFEVRKEGTPVDPADYLDGME